MLDLTDGCREFRLLERATRREMLTVGALSGMGLLLPDLLRARSNAAPSTQSGTFGRAKSVIVPVSYTHLTLPTTPYV